MPPAAKILRIAAQPDQPQLTKGQKNFNMLVKKIEACRQTLAQWQAALLAYDQKVLSEHAPLLQTFRELQAAMLRALDKALNQKGLSKPDRRVVQNIICDVAEQLILSTGDESIKAIYNKHSEADFDAEDAAALDDLKSAVAANFGVELDGAAGLDSPAAVMAEAFAQMEKDELLRQAEEDTRRQRKKTAKQLAREEKKQAEADQTSLSIREVYRKLVSALHPDRELDPEERTRKTALMQRVNQAYAKKDLLQLLELQLELEQIDAHTIAGLSEDRIKHFNRILEDQWAGLELEIAHLTMPLREQFDVPPYAPFSPDKLIPRLTRDIAALRRDVKFMQKELLIPNDPVAFKAWIKLRRREAKEWEAEIRDDDSPYF
jgi:hypothetical protein